MSEKQFNHIDNRIREAAENSEPAFDEHAWTLMEARLDKEDAKKRRYFFWWLAVPMLFITVGGIYIFSDRKGTEKLPPHLDRDGRPLEMLIKPPRALRPKSALCGPRTNSIWLTSTRSKLDVLELNCGTPST